MAALDNVYSVQVRAADPSGAVSVQTISVTVADVGEGPVFISPANITVNEGFATVGKVQAIDPDQDGIPLISIAGGADASKFAISMLLGDPANQSLDFITAPNYESPNDANADRIYEVVLKATDVAGLTATQNVTVTVLNVDESPVFSTVATISASENQTIVATIAATDPELSAVTYSITGGTDSAKFNINSTTGALTFKTAPNYESPDDANADRIYSVQVTASDGLKTAVRAFSITLTNVNETPSITSAAVFTANENQTAVGTVVASDPDGDVLTYTIIGGADAAKFIINSATGVLSFVAAPDFEAPADA